MSSKRSKGSSGDLEHPSKRSGNPESGRKGGDLNSGTRDDYSRVVANLTHELKTPLHSMLAVASVLSSEVDGSLNSEQKRQVEMIERNGEHLLELITDLLQFSSTTTETRKLNLRELDVKELFETIVGGLVPLADKVSVRIDSDFERLERSFCSDATLLRRIVGNLLSNAVKFSPDGGVVSCFAETLKDGTLHIQISDSGIGMKPEEQKVVFSEFFQADAGDTRRFGGVGLGLALVNTSLKLLGGEIELKSEPGQGTLFTLRIPTARESLEKRTILIVDEDQSARLGLQECFHSQGYETCFVSSDEDVVKEIASLQPDLVMLDVCAPQFSAFTLLEQIRNNSWGEGLPIILMSALDGPEERARGFTLGASDFIVKPFNVEELLARVRAQLERPW